MCVSSSGGVRGGVIRGVLVEGVSFSFSLILRASFITFTRYIRSVLLGMSFEGELIRSGVSIGSDDRVCYSRVC